ncbi:putative reverse transcriptase domain-containing protein [Tanacetum coccineum]
MSRIVRILPKQDEAFQILKEKLCNAPVLALPDGPDDFVVYCDASKQVISTLTTKSSDTYLTKRVKYAPKRWNRATTQWTKSVRIKYHLARRTGGRGLEHKKEKENFKPRRVRAMSITIHSGLKTKILEAQSEASKDLKAPAEWLRGLEIHFEQRDDGENLLLLIVAGFLHVGDFASLLPIREDLQDGEIKQRSYTNEIVARHGVPVLIILDRDGRFTSHLWQAFQKALGTPWKSVRFAEKGKATPRYMGPIEIVPLDEIKIDENLRFVEEPIEIVERDVKKLKKRRIPLVKVRWNSRQGEYTWEREDQFRKKYPNLFSETVPSSGVAT